DLEELIPGFLENRNKDIELLDKAVAAGDFQSLQSIGHTLKGVGGGYGFDRMSEIGAAIENAGKDADLDAARGQVDALRDYLARIDVVFE
ncbi:MAG: Hpt domain-containing protein, partial [Gammaproteobacteria bacterium]